MLLFGMFRVEGLIRVKSQGKVQTTGDPTMDPKLEDPHDEDASEGLEIF